MEFLRLLGVGILSLFEAVLGALAGFGSWPDFSGWDRRWGETEAELKAERILAEVRAEAAALKARSQG